MTSTTQPAYFTRTKRFRCPVHHGKNLSVAVGYIDGRAWAKCWSQGCASADILAALGITTSSSIPWTPPRPPRPRPTFNVETLPPISPFAASEYLKGDTYTRWLINRLPTRRRPAWEALAERHQAEKPRRRRRRLAAPAFRPAGPVQRNRDLLGRGRKRCRDLGDRWPDCFHRAEGSPELTLGRLHRACGPGQGNRPPGVPLW